MKELLDSTQVIVTRMLAQLTAFVESVRAGTPEVSSPTFLGLIALAFLLGLLLGRMSKQAVRDASEDSFRGAPGGVVLDLEELTPLGMSAEEETESRAMDISALRADGGGDETARGDEQDRMKPPTLQDSV